MLKRDIFDPLILEWLKGGTHYDATTGTLTPFELLNIEIISEEYNANQCQYIWDDLSLTDIFLCKYVK